jgi:hypothetical protein
MKWKLPFQVLRDQYISFFGGWSIELRKNEIGLNSRNLGFTDIYPYVDKVMVRKFEGKRRLPFLLSKWFTVIPLGRESPDAFSKSPEGEVVLSESGRESINCSDLRKGDLVVLNNVLGKRGDVLVKRPEFAIGLDILKGFE